MLINVDVLVINRITNFRLLYLRNNKKLFAPGFNYVIVRQFELGFLVVFYSAVIT